MEGFKVESPLTLPVRAQYEFGRRVWQARDFCYWQEGERINRHEIPHNRFLIRSQR